jgi:excisionase family DNA binding protein
MRKKRVRLKKELIEKGEKYSLFLDYYPAMYNPATKRISRKHYLHLHLFVNPQNEAQIQHNKEAQGVANEVYERSVKQIEKPTSELLKDKVQEKDKPLTHQIVTTMVGFSAIERDILNIHEASELTHYAEHTIYQLIYTKSIPFIKHNRRVLFSKQALIEWLKGLEG